MIFSIAEPETSAINMAARRLPSKLLAAVLAFGLLLPFIAAAAQADIQRMRLPAGSYYISGGSGGSGGGDIGGGAGGGHYGTVRVVRGGGGGSSSLGGGIYRSPGAGGAPARAPGLPSFPSSDVTSYLPARCIDGADEAPSSSTILFGAGAELVVRQVRGDRIVAERPLSEAVSGPDKWLEISGTDDGSYREIAVKVLKKGYDYFLDAPNGAIFADAQGLANETANAITENAGLSEFLAAADQLEGDLATLSPGIANEMLRVKQSHEWTLFADSRIDPNSIAQVSVDSDRQKELMQQLLPSDDTERLAWLVMHADVVDDSFLSDVLKVGRFKNHDRLATDLQALRSPSFRTKLDFVKRESLFFASDVMNAARRGMPISASLNAAVFLQYDNDFWLLADPFLYALYALAEFPFVDDGIITDAASKARQALLVQNDGLVIPPSDRYALVRRYYDDRIVIYSFTANGELRASEFGASPTAEQIAEAGIADGTILLVHDDLELVNTLGNTGYSSRMLYEEYRSLRQSAFDEVQTADGLQLKRKYASNTAVQYLSLGNIFGDTILVETPIDNLTKPDMLVIDTGNNGEAFINSIKAAIARRGADNKMRLLITHTDADHIRGAQRILQDPAFDVQEVIIGHGVTITGLAQSVIDLLDQNVAFDRGPAYGDSIFHYVKKGVQPAVQLQWSDGKLIHLLVRGGTAYVDLYQMKQPQSTNDSGFIIRIEEAGNSHLLTDDATARSLEAFAEEGPLSAAGVLKWPHHLWFPSANTGQMELLKRIVQDANPHTILLTNRGHGQSENNAVKISEFVKEILGKEVRVIWTKPTGRVTISMLRKKPLFNELAFHDFYEATSETSFAVPSGSPVYPS